MWTQISDDSTSLAVRDQVRVSLTFGYIPPMYPSDADMTEKLNASGNFAVSSIGHPTFDVFGTWDIDVQIKRPITVGELKAEIQNALNEWYTWNVEIQRVAINVGFRPEDLKPSVSTTVIIAAVAIILVILFLVFKEIK